MSETYVFIKDAPPKMKGIRGRETDPRLIAFVEHIKKNPGEWFAWRENQKTGANHKKRFPGTEWTSRRQQDGMFKTWGRWVAP